MIEKFIKIENVGKFRAFNAQGDTSFNKFTVLFGENAIGKSTITSILWSLKENKPEIIRGRKTIDTNGQIKIDLRINSTNYNFDESACNNTYPNLEIFDKKFIKENVYFDYFVDSSHKKQFIELALGEEAVKVSERIVEIDGLVRELNAKIRDVKNEIIRVSEIAEHEFYTFIRLDEVSDIDKKIAEQIKKVERARNADEIKRQEKLKIIELPIIDTKKIENFLNNSLENISVTIIENVQNYIIEQLETASGEKWLKYGIERIKDDKCPFCTQSIKKIDIVENFKSYFDKSYKDFSAEIETSGNQFRDLYSNALISTIDQILRNNLIQWNFWKSILRDTIHYNDIENEKYSSVIKSINEKIDQLVADKLSRPLEQQEFPQSLDLIIADYNELFEFIDEFNKNLVQINEEIDKVKSESLDISFTLDEQKLKILKLNKIRFLENVKRHIKNYIEQVQNKDNLTTEKDEKKDKLRELATTGILKYKNRINYFLTNFGADFKIETTSPNFSGGKPNVDYAIIINNRSIPIGSNNTAESQPCFKNTLSEGDKNALALAFFLSKIEKDDSIDNKTIVFDDPVNSLDIHRMNATCDKIVQFSDLTEQTLIFTHNLQFLKKIYEKSKHLQTKYTRLKLESNSYKII